MCVANTGQVLARGAVLHGQSSLVDELAGNAVDDVNAQNAVGGGVAEDLDEALGLADRLGAAVGCHGELADLVLHSL